MESYQALTDKWRGRLEQGTAGHNFDLEKLAPGKFCVAYSDAGGESMACYSEVQVVGFFDDARDFLGFLRFVEIPRVLDFDTDTNRDQFPDVADAYILEYEGEQRERIDRLIGLIDRSLKSETISVSGLSHVCNRFNEVFQSTNPAVQILAWGSLADVLSLGHLEEEFEEAMIEEQEADDDDRPVTMLKALLDAGDFDENDEQHLALARDFLEQALSF